MDLVDIFDLKKKQKTEQMYETSTKIAKVLFTFATAAPEGKAKVANIIVLKILANQITNTVLHRTTCFP